MPSTRTPEQLRVYRKAHPEQVKASAQKRTAADNALWQRRQTNKKRAMTNALKDVPCMDCGQRFPPECMDFDHRDPATKSFGIGSSLMNYGIDVLLAEIAKCDIVCANCHRVRTHRKKS